MTDLPPDWLSTAEGLSARLLGLADGGELVLAATDHALGPLTLRPRRLWGLVPEKLGPSTPEVVLVRQEDHLRAEATGSSRFGGPVAYTPEQEAAMLARGWHERAGREGDRYASYWPDDIAVEPYLPAPLAQQAAARVVRTLAEVWGCPSPEQVRWSPPA